MLRVPCGCLVINLMQMVRYDDINHGSSQMENLNKSVLIVRRLSVQSLSQQQSALSSTLRSLGTGHYTNLTSKKHFYTRLLRKQSICTSHQVSLIQKNQIMSAFSRNRYMALSNPHVHGFNVSPSTLQRLVSKTARATHLCSSIAKAQNLLTFSSMWMISSSQPLLPLFSGLFSPLSNLNSQ